MLILIWLLALSMICNVPASQGRVLAMQGLAVLAWLSMTTGWALTPGPMLMEWYFVGGVTLMAAVELVWLQWFILLTRRPSTDRQALMKEAEKARERLDLALKNQPAVKDHAR